MKWLAGLFTFAFVSSYLGWIVLLVVVVLLALPFTFLGEWVFSRELDTFAFVYLLAISVVTVVAVLQKFTGHGGSTIATIVLVALTVASFMVANAHANYGYGDGDVILTTSGNGIGAPLVPCESCAEYPAPVAIQLPSTVTTHYKVRYQYNCPGSDGYPAYFRVGTYDMGTPILEDSKQSNSGFGDFRYIPGQSPMPVTIYVTSTCKWSISVVNAGNLPDWAKSS